MSLRSDYDDLISTFIMTADGALSLDSVRKFVKNVVFCAKIVV